MSNITLHHAARALAFLGLAALGTGMAAEAKQKPTSEPVIGSPLPLAELPPQEMEKGNCAMFLWERSTRRRVLMATAQPAGAKVIHGGKAASLAQTGAEGAAVMGFSPIARYAGENFAIGLNLAIDANESGGAIVRDGTLTFTASDGTAVVAPVAGIIGCK